MAALYDGKQYLIEKYAVAASPSLQLLPPRPLEKLKLKVLGAGLTQARQGFSALPNVGVELSEIASEVSKNEILLNHKFTSEALQQELDRANFPIVHLATHGQFSSQQAQTFLLAWNKPIRANEFGNLMRSKDPTNTIELLVLSACRTAAGDRRAALGLAGIAVRAGARSTVASLWSLDDESSAQFMSAFYQGLSSNLSKAQALRQAQLAMLQNPLYRSPRYWASFVLLGSWL
jgi:CHAT domain-containing protein